VNGVVPVVDVAAVNVAWLLAGPEAGGLIVAVGAAALNVEFANVLEIVHPVARLTIVTVALAEQTFGLTEKVIVCWPLTSEAEVTAVETPSTVTETWDGEPAGKKSVPIAVTEVAEPPGPDSGAKLVIVGTLIRNVPGADAVSPSDSSVTLIVPPLLGQPAGGFARICVPETEMTVPC